MTDLAEQLRIVELLIERAKRRQDGMDDDMLIPLREIAKGLRARISAPQGEILRQLEDKMRSTLATKTRLGYSAGHLADIGTFAIGHWQTLRQALEAFQEE